MFIKILGITGGIGLLMLFLWPSQGPKKTGRLYNKAEDLYQSSRYSEAISMYEQALEEGKKHPDEAKWIDQDFSILIKYKIAVCYCRWAAQGDISLYTEAESIVKAIYPTATVPKHREGITYLWGYILFKQGRYEEADPKFRELIENFPQSPYVENALYALGKLHLKLEQPEKSRKAFQQLLK